MPEMYAVSAVHASGRQIPTFYLLTNVQGIVSEAHAAEIAARIVGPDCNICVAATSFGAHGDISYGRTSIVLREEG